MHPYKNKAAPPFFAAAQAVKRGLVEMLATTLATHNSGFPLPSAYADIHIGIDQGKEELTQLYLFLLLKYGHPQKRQSSSFEGTKPLRSTL
jgi:hypothetical protein